MADIRVSTESEKELLQVILDETSLLVDLNTPLDSLDLDSLEFMELIRVIEDKFNVKISDTRIASMKTVEDLYLASVA